MNTHTCEDVDEWEDWDGIDGEWWPHHDGKPMTQDDLNALKLMHYQWQLAYPLATRYQFNAGDRIKEIIRQLEEELKNQPTVSILDNGVRIEAYAIPQY